MSVLHFHVDEVFEMAVQIERHGARFYHRAAQGVDNPQVSQLLLDLAAMEEQHEKVFADMRTELSEGTWAAAPPVDEQETSYLRAWADAHVFDVKKDPVERLSGKEAAEDILRMAIGLEKDSIVFYLGIKEVVPEGAGQDRIDAIIREEMNHITTLSKQLASQ